MDYQKHYEQLIAKHGSRDKPDGYSERHHILPKSMGGSDEASNLVYLSAKAHFVAHHLLWRWHRNSPMACAFHFMCHGQQKDYYQPSANVYQEAKTAHIKAFTGSGNHRFGKSHSAETISKMSAKNSGANHPMARRANIYCYKTKKVVAAGVILNIWCKENKFSQPCLSRTARGDRKQHKGHYAQYI